MAGQGPVWQLGIYNWDTPSEHFSRQTFARGVRGGLAQLGCLPLAHLIPSAYYQQLFYVNRSNSFQLKGFLTQYWAGQCRQGSRANGEGIHGLEGLGWEGWRVVVVGGDWGETQYKKHANSPNGQEAHFHQPLLYIELGCPMAGSNNFVCYETVEKL